MTMGERPSRWGQRWPRRDSSAGGAKVTGLGATGGAGLRFRVVREYESRLEHEQEKPVTVAGLESVVSAPEERRS
ncbi:hypothetical protein GCM10010468_01780 [Actinocorallia longicatena]|uniref:Uncharacterized protein n=1 Tax=Actinocorallia longicatena TaxID=111803 RepID=A0ABP6PVP6_9ACTN